MRGGKLSYGPSARKLRRRKELATTKTLENGIAPVISGSGRWRPRAATRRRCRWRPRSVRASAGALTKARFSAPCALLLGFPGETRVEGS